MSDEKTTEELNNLAKAGFRYRLLDGEGRVIGYASHRPSWLPEVKGEVAPKFETT